MNAISFLADALSRERPLTAAERRLVDLANGTAPFRRWTPQDDAKLMKMHKAKLHSEHMAAALGRTSNSIRLRLRDLKKRERAGRSCKIDNG